MMRTCSGVRMVRPQPSTTIFQARWGAAHLALLAAGKAIIDCASSSQSLPSPHTSRKPCASLSRLLLRYMLATR